MFLGAFYEFNCEFERSLQHFKKALEINASVNCLWGIAAMKSHISMNYYFQGDMTLADEIGVEAIRIANKSGDVYSRAHTYILYGRARYGKGRFEEAKEHLKKGFKLAEGINQPVIASWAYDFLAETYYAMGKYKKAQEQWENAISILQKNSLYPSLINLYKMAQDRKKSRQEKKLDLASLQEVAHAMKSNALQSRVRRYMGEILLNLDDHHILKAEEWITKAIDADKRNGMLFYLGKDYALYAELLKRKKDLPQARESLSQAVEIYEKCGADGWKREAEKALASLN
jgi:tetratricopeptide (TPR) repeat protein